MTLATGLPPLWARRAPARLRLRARDAAGFVGRAAAGHEGVVSYDVFGFVLGAAVPLGCGASGHVVSRRCRQGLGPLLER